MAGLSDYAAEYLLNWATGQQGAGARYLALFTAAPNDSGSGGTEVSGTGYARVQVAGTLAAGASWTTGNSAITLGSTAPAWLTALGSNGSGVNVYDVTNSQQIGTVSSISGTTVTLTGTAAHASAGSADSLAFSAFPAASASSGAEPATTPAYVANGAAIAEPQSTASWGTVLAWGLYDAATAGNYLIGDYLGANKWIPFSCSLASPGVLTVDSSADVPANGSSIVVSSKYGGTLPTTSGSWSGPLTVAGASGNTFNAGVNTSSTGGGLFRQITQQSIPANVTFSFAASGLTVAAA
jgi:hypothetical protein